MVIIAKLARFVKNSSARPRGRVQDKIVVAGRNNDNLGG